NCPADRLNEKDNELVCSGKSKQVRCGYDRLSLSTRFAMRNVERADAGKTGYGSRKVIKFVAGTIRFGF
ncbi:MAG: hypothetical protein Q7J80_18005, partial [Anaerolineales bacterium]|nr:hypothetical protein [Anaerolineales bacterium]